MHAIGLNWTSYTSDEPTPFLSSGGGQNVSDIFGQWVSQTAKQEQVSEYNLNRKIFKHNSYNNITNNKSGRL